MNFSAPATRPFAGVPYDIDADVVGVSWQNDAACAPSGNASANVTATEAASN
jgi:hypothetical protein